MDEPSPDTAILQIPSNFNSMVYDFITDLSTTFPEYAFLWKRWANPKMPMEDQEELFLFFSKVFPERFFDILYQNDDIFGKDSETNTVFLPNVDFKILFHCGNITENTKKAIWKYLQLILISVLNSVQNKTHFGDAATLFEGFDENVIQEKLNETIEGISDFFKNLGTEKQSASASASESSTSDFNPDEMFEKMAREMGENGSEDFQNTFGFNKTEGMPNAEELHEHLKGLFDGKIGSLAKEMAEEISEDMKEMFEKDGTDDIRSTQDILKKMVKNPKKIMDLMKNIGAKLQTKMKSGEISEEEIMKEASELMGKMKGMGGNGGFADIMKNMAQGLAGGKAKFNTGAFTRMEKQMATKERMMNKLEQRRQGKSDQQSKSEPQVKYSLNTTETPNDYVFKLDEEDVQEKTVIKRHDNVDIDALVKDIESVGQPSAESKQKTSKKKKGKK
jgi:hypothetical protein